MKVKKLSHAHKGNGGKSERTASDVYKVMKRQNGPRLYPVASGE